MSFPSSQPSPASGRGAFGARAVEHFSAAALLLGWRPNEFWAATPAELSAALGGVSGGANAPDKKLIEALRKRFPDQ